MASESESALRWASIKSIQCSIALHRGAPNAARPNNFSKCARRSVGLAWQQDKPASYLDEGAGAATVGLNSIDFYVARPAAPLGWRHVTFT